MKDISHNSLKYFPVGAEKIKLPLKYSASFMLNVFRKLSYQSLKVIREKENICCDSGGLQIFEASEKGKRVAVGPMLRTRNNRSVLTLGTIDNCMIYRRTKSTMALMIDRPVYLDDSDFEYYKKLLKSRKARDQMLRAAHHLCPNTDLIIALQPRNPLEIANYFSWIYTPYVRIYAYPIRSIRNKPKDALGNAYALSFLSNVGIKHVHFLGSNAPPIIFLLAHAIALGMFNQASFDSRTWDQQSFSGIRYLHPITLNPVPSIKIKSLHPNSNLRTVLKKHNGIFEATLGCFNPPEWVVAHDWLGILNIKIIENFKDVVLSAALNSDLKHFIKEFPKYGQKGKEQMIEAIDLLEESVEYEHDHIEQKYGARIKELYS